MVCVHVVRDCHAGSTGKMFQVQFHVWTWCVEGYVKFCGHDDSDDDDFEPMRRFRVPSSTIYCIWTTFFQLTIRPPAGRPPAGPSTSGLSSTLSMDGTTNEVCLSTSSASTLSMDGNANEVCGPLRGPLMVTRRFCFVHSRGWSLNNNYYLCSFYFISSSAVWVTWSLFLLRILLFTFQVILRNWLREWSTSLSKDLQVQVIYCAIQWLVVTPFWSPNFDLFSQLDYADGSVSNCSFHS